MLTEKQSLYVYYACKVIAKDSVARENTKSGLTTIFGNMEYLKRDDMA